MSGGLTLLVELVAGWVSTNPDAAILLLLGGGAYYELHHGQVHEMARNQEVLGRAVYVLMARSEAIDEEEFREDLWGSDNGGYHPGDWELERSDGDEP